MSRLIKLRIIRNVMFWHNTDYAPPMHYNRTIIKLLFKHNRRAYHTHHINLICLIRYSKHSVFRTAQKYILRKQISAGISAHAQLRKNRKLNAALIRLFYVSYNIIRIIFAVCNSYIRRNATHFYKTIFHVFLLIC